MFLPPDLQGVFLKLPEFTARSSFLRAIGIRPVGVVSPFGVWNPSFQRAIRLLGFDYSSEFAIGVEDIPFKPLQKIENPTQLPISNISIGLIPEGESDRFLNLLRASIALQLEYKTLIYHHPLNRLENFAEEYENLIREVLEQGASVITMETYYRLWSKRPILRDATFDRVTA